MQEPRDGWKRETRRKRDEGPRKNSVMKERAERDGCEAKSERNAGNAEKKRDGGNAGNAMDVRNMGGNSIDETYPEEMTR